MVNAAVCQSCMMPLVRPGDHGTEAGGKTSEEFCTHCYQGGEYTAPDLNIDQMAEIVGGFTEKPGDEATKAARQSLVDLKRWQ